MDPRQSEPSSVGSAEAEGAGKASRSPRFTRASAAWVATATALVLLVLLIVVILQNTTRVVVHFLRVLELHLTWDGVADRRRCRWCRGCSCWGCARDATTSERPSAPRSPGRLTQLRSDCRSYSKVIERKSNPSWHRAGLAVNQPPRCAFRRPAWRRQARCPATFSLLP